MITKVEWVKALHESLPQEQIDSDKVVLTYSKVKRWTNKGGDR